MTTNEGILERISALSPRQQELLAKRLAGGGSTRPSADLPIGKRGPGRPALSFAQQRLWFLDQLDPGSPHYNVPMAARIRGAVDAAVLEQSLNLLVERHEVLRTTFTLGDGGPVQVIHDRMRIPLEFTDLSEVPAGERNGLAEELAAAHGAVPFDLETGPLVRAGLIRLSPTEHIMMSNIHHIIADTWSIGVILTELSATYDALTHGQAPPLTEPRVQYADFAEWQRGWLQGEVLDAQLEYWRGQLGGDIPMLDLPFDRPRPVQPSFRGAILSHFLSRETSSRIDALAAGERSGVFSVFLAGLATLLSRYSGQDKVGIGSPVANRTRPELADMVGYLSNTVLLRVDLAGAETFREAVRRAHETNVGAQSNQDLPFDKIVEIVQPQRDVSGTPLIQVMVVFRPPAPEDLPSGGLPGLDEALTVDNGTSKFDLTFSVESNRGVYRFAIEYATDLFDEPTVRRIAEHWETLLSAAVAEPDTAIAALPVLTEPERCEIVVAWNGTDTAYPADSCLHELFEANADLAPDAVAVIAGPDRLSYAELDRRANQLARHLRGLGAGPDIPVAISMDKSLDLVVGLLAIAKAGSAYLPLDPTYPADRLAFMLGDAAAPILLTQSHLAGRLPAPQSVAVVVVDALRAEIAAQPDTRPQALAGPENLAYVIYTSGSTGRPKGVLLDHRGRVNNFHDFVTRFGIGAGDRVFGLASTGFDMSAFDVFGTLMAGATLSLPEPGSERDPAHWLEVCRRDGVTVWHSVPALLEMFVELCEAEPGSAVPPLRLVLLGGDWIPLTLPDRLRRLAPDAEVISLGGATEVSMDSTIFPVGAVAPDWRSIPYGKPMANQRCFVLDAAMQPVPVGVAGDLYLGGVGVGRGYLNAAELSAQRFLDNPLPEWPGERIYRTGDRAKYRPDGNLELLGRSDFQVKIRGWRIEPGEVEAALRAQEGVKEALVAVTPDDGSPRRLIAYVVAEPDCAADPEALREALRGGLPEHMVPAVVVLLDAFPLTPNGKIDRRALPLPGIDGDPSDAHYVGPCNRTERVLVDIWQELLRAERVGTRDNFFRLGGDSIKAIQVIAKARRLGVGLTPKQLFGNQTIAELAAVATDTEMTVEADTVAELSAPTPAELETLQAAHPDLVAAYPLTPMQRHMLRRLVAEPRPGQYIIQVDYLFVPGGLDVALLEKSWQVVVDRHPVLRSSFAWEGLSEPVQIVHSRSAIEVERHDLTGLDTDAQVRRQDEIVQADRERGFDLTTAPLLRLIVLTIAPDTYKYLFTNHHIVLDGWSRAIVQQEVFAAYEALAAGREPALPPQRSLRDYVAWLRSDGRGEDGGFWERYLDGVTEPTPILASKGVANPVPGPEFAKQRSHMSAEATTAMHEFCRRSQLTPNSVVQGAWLLLLAAYTGRRDIVLGVTSSGRSTEFVGVETVTGLCMNTLPLRVELDEERPLAEWLQALQVHQVELRQYEHSPVEEILGREMLDLFQCQMVFENYPWDGSLSALASRVEFDHPMAERDYQVAQFEFPLRVEVVPGPQQLLLMHYYPGCFAHETVTSMIEDWKAMIARIVSEPGATLGSLLAAQLGSAA